MRRTLVGAALPAAAVVIAAGSVLLWWSRLPEDIAVHWNLGGRADGSMSRVGGLALLVALTGIAALVVVTSVWRGATVPVAGLAAFFAGLFATITLTTVLLTVTSWTGGMPTCRRWRDPRSCSVRWQQPPW